MKKFALLLVVLLLVGTVAFAQGAKDTGKKFIGLAMPETHVER